MQAAPRFRPTANHAATHARAAPPRTRSLRPAAAAVVLLGACAPASGPTPVIAENEAIALTLMAAWEAGDVQAATDLFWPGAVYDDFPNSTQHRGIAEIGAYVGHVHSWASDVVINVTAVHASEGGAVAEWVFSAVQSQPIAGRVEVATGKEFVLNGVTILEIDGGLVRRAADYIDTLPLVLQLGARVEMPGGTVIELGGG